MNSDRTIDKFWIIEDTTKTYTVRLYDRGSKGLQITKDAWHPIATFMTKTAAENSIKRSSTYAYSSQSDSEGCGELCAVEVALNQL